MKPAVLARTGGDLSLSNASLTALMKDVLDKGKPFRFKARGSSMSPFVREGDIVTVSPPAAERLQTGTIVAFVHPTTCAVAVHRIVKSRPGRYSLRGDRLDVEIGDVASDRILGVVTDVRRDGRCVGGRSRRLAAAIAFLSRIGLLDALRRLRGRTKARQA